MNIIDGLTADDVLLIPKYSEIDSRSNVSVSVDLGKGIVLNCPIVSSNMKDIGSDEMILAISDIGGLALMHRFEDYENIVTRFKNLTKEEWRKNFIGCSVGVHEKDKKLVDDCVGAGCKIICVDVAHGHSKISLNMVSWIHNKYPDVLLIAGNIATADGARHLYMAGADVCKCGIGSGCFAAGTRVMMANGIYKNIEEVQIGDRVINKDGNAVSVKNVVMTGVKKVVKIRHDLSHKDTFVTEDHKYWVGDSNTMSDLRWKEGDVVKKLDLLTKKGESKFKWKQVKDLNKDSFLMPNKINFELQENFSIPIKKRDGGNNKNSVKYKIDVILSPSYDLGYIFGTFLGYGNSFQASNGKSMIGRVSWYFGSNEEYIVNKLNNCIKNVFNKELSIDKQKSIFNCKLYYKPFADFLASFGKKNKKHLPEHLLVSNKEYLQGILDGLIDSDGHIEPSGRKRFNNTSEQLIELFSTLSYLLYGTFASGNARKISIGGLKNCNVNNCLESWTSSINKTASKKLTKDYQVSLIRNINNLEMYLPVYDIEVDCDTHSFIANFAIVHNSICSTRIMTGNGVPQLTAVESVYRESLNYDVQQSEYVKENRKFKIIADGGIRKSGDGTKYLCFSDVLMLGNVIAGTDEAPGETMIIDGIKYKQYAGSSTLKTKHVEGAVGLVPSKGPVKDVIESFLEGIKSGCAYQGVDNLKDLKKDPQFVKITNAGLAESHPHSIKIIK